MNEFIEKYKEMLRELQESYDNGLISGKEYIHAVIANSLDYDEAAANIKDTYEP